MNPTKNQEVEKRVLLSEEEFNSIAEYLSETREYEIQRSAIKDNYLCPKSVKEFSEIEMDEVGSYALRIRSKTNEAGDSSTSVNAKVITNYGDHSAWDEHEIQVDKESEALSIFHSTGFKTFFVYDKKRTSFKKGNLTICLEEIEDFGYAIEVEIISPPSLSQQAKEEIDIILSNLGISKKRVVSKSITNIAMRQNAKF